MAGKISLSFCCVQMSSCIYMYAIQFSGYECPEFLERAMTQLQHPNKDRLFVQQGDSVMLNPLRTLIAGSAAGLLALALGASSCLAQGAAGSVTGLRSEEHTSELQSL